MFDIMIGISQGHTARHDTR